MGRSEKANELAARAERLGFHTKFTIGQHKGPLDEVEETKHEYGYRLIFWRSHATLGYTTSSIGISASFLVCSMLALRLL